MISLWSGLRPSRRLIMASDTTGHYDFANITRFLTTTDNFGLLHASAGCQTHGPALERTRFHRLGQDDVRSFIQNRAHMSIADLGDAAAHVLLPGLVALRRHPEMSADLLGVRIPTKPDGDSNRETGHRSDLKPDTIPI